MMFVLFWVLAIYTAYYFIKKSKQEVVMIIGIIVVLVMIFIATHDLLDKK